MPRALLAAALALCTLVSAFAQESAVAEDLDPDLVNTVCGEDGSSGQFKLSKIGPIIAGTYEATAPGIGYATGVQHFPVVISFERGRVYGREGDGPRVELKPVYGTRKALRYDPIRQKHLPERALAVKELSLEDIEIVTNCKADIAPQFTWTHGMGAKSSGGIYTFFTDRIAIGTMWNSAMGAREVRLQR